VSDRVIVAIVQANPAYLDLEQSLAKAEALTAEAAEHGAGIVAFGESWLAGYPIWLDYCPGSALWDYAPAKDVFAALRRNSLEIPGPETRRLGRLAARHGVTLVVGAHERVRRGPGNGTLYNALLIFGPDGRLLNHHRKLVPTYSERLVWGQGDADGLRAVETPFGRVGGLICWEHWMPLARQVIHTSGEQIHVALWPSVTDLHHLASRHYAFEGRCFVLAAGLITRVRDLPEAFETLGPPRGDPDALLHRGGSAIIGPDGRYIAGPVFDEETILVAEIDPGEIDRHVMTLDVTGHSARPDLFDLTIRSGSRQVTFDEGEPS
jgi:nitrilase